MIDFSGPFVTMGRDLSVRAREEDWPGWCQDAGYLCCLLSGKQVSIHI